MINPNILINNQLVLLLDHDQLKTMFVFGFATFVNHLKEFRQLNL